MNLVYATDIKSRVKKYADEGMASGFSTGWKEMDQHFNLLKGNMNIITGIPSSGKSEFLDQLILQTIAIHGWHWCIFSPENWPLEYHIGKLVEKWVGLPFFNGQGMPRLTQEDLSAAIDDIGGCIAFIHPEGDEQATLDNVLEAVGKASDECGTDAFLLDPWNELEHARSRSTSETEHIGKCLSKIRNFGRRRKISMNIVAHPTKLKKDDDGAYPVARPYDISGSANWYNKADGCLSVWRDYEDEDHNVQVHIQKVRNKMVGTLGKVEMQWSYATGLFTDRPGFPHKGVRGMVK